MKRDTLEKWMLLEQSGELGPLRAWRLRRALRHDAAARRFREDLLSITASARDSADEIPVSRATMAAILDDAQRLHDNARPAPFWARPALAFAALVLAALALRFALVRPDVPGDSVARRDAAPEPSTALAWDDGFDSSLATLEGELTNTDSDWVLASNPSDLDDWIEVMMNWEGSKI